MQKKYKYVCIAGTKYFFTYRTYFVLFRTFTALYLYFHCTVAVLTTVLQSYYLEMLSGGIGVVAKIIICVMADFGKETGECSWLLETFILFPSK